MRVRFLQKGIESNFRRIGDQERTVFLYKWWKSGGLLYGYLDRFNTICIPLEDIIETEEAI